MDYRIENYFGDKHGKQLIKNNIFDLFMLLNKFPKKYDYFFLEEFIFKEEAQTIKGIIVSEIFYKVHRKNLKSLSFDFKTGDNLIKVTIFGREYLREKLREGLPIVMKGSYNLNKKVFGMDTIFFSDYTDHIKAIYDLENIFDYQASQSVKKALNIIDFKENLIPFFLLEKYQLLNDKETYQKIHFPACREDILLAKRKLKYQEALIFQLAINYNIRKKVRNKISSLEYDITEVKEFIAKLPFVLTDDQKEAVNQLFIDFKYEYPLERLIEGDVGSGKTIVVAIAFFALAKKYQIAFMAPTEILAKQHFTNISNYFTDYKINIEFLSSSIKGKKREEILRRLKNKEIDLLIGTHAIIQPDIEFFDLRYIVIDEEHRFGVLQKQFLQKKSEKSHVISLSATPIPKSLASTILQDVRITRIISKPKERRKIVTKVINDKEVSSLIKKMQEEINKKNQVFVIAPLISESEKLALKNVIDIHEKFKNIFTGTTEVGLLHGKLKNAEKMQVSKDFAENKLGILVSTTVVEVGLDIKNATVMVVLDAERFGVSTLHQLRGRVGRNDLESFCYFVSKNDDKERLKILETVDDCFLLSEFDLKMRGPGEFFGTKQSGFLNFAHLDFIEDFKILETAKKDATEILDEYNLSQTSALRKLYLEVEKTIANFVKNDII